MKRQAKMSPNWDVVKSIHRIHDEGGKLDKAEITVSKGKTTIKRTYLMPHYDWLYIGNGIRQVRSKIYLENDYDGTEQRQLDLEADLFMLECDQ